jgi:hypothetical protein
MGWSEDDERDWLARRTEIAEAVQDERLRCAAIVDAEVKKAMTILTGPTEARGAAVAIADYIREKILDGTSNGWLPIGTAPKDGTVVWVASAHSLRLAKWRSGDYYQYRDFVGGGWADFAGLEHHDVTDLQFSPTHWLPIPKCPQDGETMLMEEWYSARITSAQVEPHHPDPKSEQN